MQFGIGQPVTRKEDQRFLTGRGRFVADIDLARQTYAVFLYSPHAHARIRAIDIAAAQRAPGVYAVLTGQDWVADGLGTLDPEVMPEDMGGPKGHRTKRPPLAIDRVRYVGERVAVAIAAGEDLARDAAELIAIDYELLPAVVTAADAVTPGALLVHDDIPGNVSVTLRMGNAEAVEPAFARAHHVTRLSLVNNRITAVTMEPRGCIAEYDAGTGRYALYTSTPHVHGVRHLLAHQILHVPESRIRVVARDVGGGFGMKGQLYAEEAVVVWASRRVGRPVKWIPTRTEAMLGDNDGRDQTVEEAELALSWPISPAVQLFSPCRFWAPLPRSDRLRAKAERAHRPGDVLDRLLAEIIEGDGQLVADLVTDRARDAQPTRFAQGLQSRGHVDTVAEDVVRLDDDIAKIDADAEYKPALIGHGDVSGHELPLNSDRASDRFHSARKLNEDAVARRLDDASATSGDGRVYQLSTVSHQLPQSADLISTHQAAVANDIRRQDR